MCWVSIDITIERWSLWLESSVESSFELSLLCELKLIESVIFYRQKNLPTVEMGQFYSEDSPLLLNCYEEEDHVHNKSFTFSKISYYKITNGWNSYRPWQYQFYLKQGITELKKWFRLTLTFSFYLVRFCLGEQFLFQF